MYTCKEMNMSDALMERTLAPLTVHLPWASLASEAGNMTVSCELHAPNGAQILDITQNIHAYLDLRKHAPLSKATVISAANLDNGRFQHSWPCLPDKPWVLFFWLSLPDDAASLVSAPAQPLDNDNDSSVEILANSDCDSEFMKVGCPGNGKAMQLVRATLHTQPVPREQGVVKFLYNLNISDASGSTGIECSSSLLFSNLI